MSFSVPSTTLYVRGQNDLPPPLGGVIAIPENVTVQPEGQIDLDPGVSLLVPNTSDIVGRDADTDGFVGDVDGPLINTAGNGLIVRNVFLRNFSVSVDAFCIRTTTAGEPNPRVTRIESVSVGGTRGILIDTATLGSIQVLLDRCDEEGIVFRGVNAGFQVINQTKSNATAPTPVGVMFEAASETNACTFRNSTYALQAAGAVGIYRDATASLNSVSFLDNTFLVLIAGALALDGIAADDFDDVLFISNYGVVDSKTGGSIGIDGNPLGVTTVIAVAGAFVAVGTGAVAHPAYVLDPSSARVALNQPGGAASALLEMTATEPVNCMVFASVSARTAAGAALVAVRVVKNPGGGQVVLVPGFTSLLDRTVDGAFAFQTSTIMLPGDELQLQVANLTTVDALIVDSVNLSLFVAGT